MSILKTDEDIVELYKNGNREIFKELIDRYSHTIFNFTAHLVGKKEATDIVQDIFIKIWKNLNKFNSKKSSFKTWIFVIAKNTCVDFLKKKKSILFSEINNNEMVDFSETIIDETPLPIETLQKLQDSKILADLLEKLPLNYKIVLILYYQEEMTFEEIGKTLNKPLNTVKSHHRRAILELRKKLK